MLTKTFTSAQWIWADIKAGVKEKIQRILKNTQPISALTMAAKLVTFTIVLAMFPVTTISAHPETESYNTAIVFDKNDPMVLKLADNQKVIAIGQSRVDEELAQAKKQAEAERQSRPTKSVSHRDPTIFRPIYQAAAQQFGIPWQLIEAVHEVETGKSGSTAVRSSAGAQGPMQFMPGTWRAYQIDGNGDGVADITDVVDAIYTGAHYLARSGADAGRIDDALFNYNRSMAYVNKVKTIAMEIGL